MFLRAQSTITSIVDKPLSEPMLSRFTDAYMRHKGEISLKNPRRIQDHTAHILKKILWFQCDLHVNISLHSD